MILFKCDICGEVEDLKSNTQKIGERQDVCRTCLDLLSKAADLFKLEGFKEQLLETHQKFFGENT